MKEWYIIGVTNKSIWLIKDFTKKYRLKRLVYYESYDSIECYKQREIIKRSVK
jgi:predicted GIY-YIG superfamily endonuclease